MDFRELMLIAWEGIRDNRMRSLLTVTGIVIGIAAVIILLAIGKGAELDTQKQIQSLGSNLVYISPGSASTTSISAGAGTAPTLTYADAEAIRDVCPAVQDAVAVYNQNFQVQYGGQNTSTRITASDPSFADVRNIKAVKGRFFNQADFDSYSRVCVLGDTVVENLFGEDENPIGKSVLIRGELFQVIGVMEHKGYSGFQDTDDAVYVPLSTGYNSLFGTNASTGKIVRNILVSLNAADDVTPAEFQITNVLRLRHKIIAPMPDDFQIRTQSDLMDTAQSVNRVFTTLLGATAGISLLVGGIGIMNIMLVSVTERTREIGIRKAIGARYVDIMMQFIIEAIVLSLTGGLLGIGIGLLGAYLTSTMAKWTTVVTPDSVVISFFVSIVIGLFFGIYPARRAAKLDPITALRAD
ncbi:MAG TPA: ABC transporter permease [Drouetiella sp.]